MVGPENAKKYQTLVFLAGSASAEFFADIGLCPWEAVKVPFVATLSFIPSFRLAHFCCDIELSRRLSQTRLYYRYFIVLSGFLCLILRGDACAGQGPDSARIRQRSVRWHAKVHLAGRRGGVSHLFLLQHEHVCYDLSSRS